MGSEGKRVWSPGVILWIIWAILLFGGFLFGNQLGESLGVDSAESQRVRIPTACRMGSSLALVLAGWHYARLGRGGELQGVTRLFAMAMTFGFLGDLSNAGLLPIQNPILGGIIAFAIGHVDYIFGCLSLERLVGRIPPFRRWSSIIVWQAFAFAGWYVIVWKGKDLGILNVAAWPYTALLAGTAGCALALSLQDRRFAVMALGGALFLFSDLVLAYEIFKDDNLAHGGDIVWLTYGPGQMMLVYSMPIALGLLSRPRPVSPGHG